MLEERIKYGLAFISFVLKRFVQNSCTSIAAELTVTSLLALVPLTAVVFSLLAFIPSFQDLGHELQTIIFQYFVPGTGDTVQAYINEFVGKAKSLSSLGTLMLVVTALLMMRTIDSSFNRIWQVESNKSIVRTILVYWAILTLGPILLGSSLLITSYIKSLPVVSEVLDSEAKVISAWLPYGMASLAFSVMYYVIPNRKIPVKHAVFSGLLTAAMFELAKWGFGIFIAKFSTYQLIFGALASVPLFLIWIYVSWGLVLLGAEFCHALEAFDASLRKANKHPFIEVVAMILLLAEYQKDGKTLDETILNQDEDNAERGLDFDWLEKMVEHELVAKTQEQTYCLLRAASKINYQVIYEIADRQFPSLADIDASNLPETTRKDLIRLSQQLHQEFSDRLVV